MFSRHLTFIDKIHLFNLDNGSSFLIDINVIVGNVFESRLGHSFLLHLILFLDSSHIMLTGLGVGFGDVLTFSGVGSATHTF